MGWLSVQDLDLALGVTSPEGDDHLDDRTKARAAQAAEAWFESKCSRRVLAVNQVGADALYLDGEGESRLWVPNGPIQSVTSLEIRGIGPVPIGSEADLFSSVVSAAFVNSRSTQTGAIVREAGFPLGTRNVKLEARIGFEANQVPVSVRHAAALIAVIFYQAGPTITRISRNASGEDEQFDFAVPEIVREVIDDFSDAGARW